MSVDGERTSLVIHLLILLLALLIYIKKMRCVPRDHFLEHDTDCRVKRDASCINDIATFDLRNTERKYLQKLLSFTEY